MALTYTITDLSPGYPIRDPGQEAGYAGNEGYIKKAYRFTLSGTYVTGGDTLLGSKFDGIGIALVEANLCLNPARTLAVRPEFTLVLGSIAPVKMFWTPGSTNNPLAEVTNGTDLTGYSFDALLHGIYTYP